MNIQPDLPAFEKLATQGNLITIYTELIADCETPVLCYIKIRNKKPAYLFESVEGGEHVNRYSIIGANPQKIISSQSDQTTIHHSNGKISMIKTPEDPLELVEKELSQYKPAQQSNLPPFVGGAVGFVSYEYVHTIEPSISKMPEAPFKVPVTYFMISDQVVIFDHAKQTLKICVSVKVIDNLKECYSKGKAKLQSIVDILQQPISQTPINLDFCPYEFKIPEGNYSKKSFKKIVNNAKEFVYAGDIVQIVLSQRFEKDYHQDPLNLYRSLRLVNPSPYMFIIESPEFTTVGASPEVHVRLTNRRVEIRPIAGTRPRGKDLGEDMLNEKDLLEDEKEKAEHLMLVDLARNDIGRVCAFDSVKVSEYMNVERYSHVMHIVSHVEGCLNKGKNAFDLMRATFPAGTVSGAPKVRAMQIISSSESSTRGIYSGALGYFSFNGNHDSCIAIRSALIQNKKIYIQSGAGIVADSNPNYEYLETLNKAKGIFKAEHLSQLFPKK